MKRGSLKPVVWWVIVLGVCFVSPVQSESKNEKEKEKPKKIKICHKGNTIEIAESALSAHLGHGDTIGACEVTPSKN